MTDRDCVAFLQQVLPRLGLEWHGFRRFRGQVCKRIARRLRALGLENDLTAYAALLASRPAEWDALAGLCRVTISRFYRDRAVWDRLRAAHLPRLAAAVAALGGQRGRPLTFWSAGSASGEEPYTLALALRLGMDPVPPFRIRATEADPALVERARAGCYASGTMRELPADWRAQAFERAGEEGAPLRLKDAFRAGVDFVVGDIRGGAVPEGPLDLVLCRNVAFTYFGGPARAQFLEQIASRLAAGGTLVLGAHEALPSEQGWRRDTPLPIYVRA